MKALFNSHKIKASKCIFFHIRNIAMIILLAQDDMEKLIHIFVTSRLDNCKSLLSGCPKKILWEDSSWSKILQQEFWQELTWEWSHYSCAGFNSLAAHKIQYRFQNTYSDLQGSQRPSSILAGETDCATLLVVPSVLKNVDLVAESWAIRAFCCGISCLSSYGRLTLPLLLWSSRKLSFLKKKKNVVILSYSHWSSYANL